MNATVFFIAIFLGHGNLASMPLLAKQTAETGTKQGGNCRLYISVVGDRLGYGWYYDWWGVNKVASTQLIINSKTSSLFNLLLYCYT
jgi:hypothetical protein